MGCWGTYGQREAFGGAEEGVWGHRGCAAASLWAAAWPQPCTAPTADLLASCLILTEWSWGREIPHINSHHQSYRRREKKCSRLQDLWAPLSYSSQKQRHTHIRTKSEGKRDPTCSLIPLSCCLRETWTGAAGSVQKVWLQRAEKQPLISNVHFTFAWHFFSTEVKNLATRYAPNTLDLITVALPSLSIAPHLWNSAWVLFGR